MKTIHKFSAWHDLLTDLEYELIKKMLIYNREHLHLRKWGIHY